MFGYSFDWSMTSGKIRLSFKKTPKRGALVMLEGQHAYYHNNAEHSNMAIIGFGSWDR